MQLAPHAEVAAAAVAVLAAAALLTRSVTTGGAVAGFVVGSLVGAGFGPQGLVVLGTFFVAGSLATKWGYEAKAARGTAEATGGARDARRVVGKGGVAAAVGVAALFAHPLDQALGAALTGALAAALADTLGTEMGTLAKNQPRMLPSFRRVPHGTPGAVSGRGTAGTALGALIIAGSVLLVDALGGDPSRLTTLPLAALALIALAGFAAALFESVLVGAIPDVKRAPGWVRNLVTTAMGAGLALVTTAALR